MDVVLSTREKKEVVEFTGDVRRIVRESEVRKGLCHVMALHATAAVLVNENDDPNIGRDLLRALDQAVPEHDDWLHDRVDNNAQAHILAATVGPSEIVPVRNGDLLLGTWQGLMLVEFDGPRRERRIAVTVMPG